MPIARRIPCSILLAALATLAAVNRSHAIAADASGPLSLAWYESIGTHSSLDTIDWSTPTRSTRSGRIEWSATNAPWEPGAPTDEFALRITTTIRAHTTGTYRFRLDSDEGSRLTIGDTLVIDHDGVHAMSTARGTITLESGFHPVTIDYFEQTGPAGLILEWRPPGASGWTVVPETSFAEPEAPIEVEWYFEDDQIRRFEDIDWQTPNLVTHETQINWANRAGSAGFLPDAPGDLFALRARTRLVVPETGRYIFRLGSDDGSRLTIDDQVIINQNNLQSFRWSQREVYLTRGTKDVEILFFENFGWAGLILLWQTPSDSTLRVIPAESYVAPSAPVRPRVVRWTAHTPIERERSPQR
jgi:hypothetical protein